MVEVVEIKKEASDLYISKEELEHIFERQDLRQQNLFKMAHYPVEDIEEIAWFFLLAHETVHSTDKRSTCLV